MLDVHDLITSIVGELAWSVKRGIGSFVTIEFGNPNLSVREPIVSKSSGSSRVVEALRRRHVTLRGTWHLWIQEAVWNIAVGDSKCMFNDDESLIDEVLNKLDGQRVISVDFLVGKPDLVISFDLGGILKVTTLPEKFEADATAWSFHRWDGPTISVLQAGDVSLGDVVPASS